MNETDLFDTGPAEAAAELGGRPSALQERVGSIRRSALWAAYGDALGWISELTTPAGLVKRTAGAALVEPVAWARRIGGRSGVVANLPRGCYSDDSQLRLATARAITADGFDVEAFAKVELPVWLSYEFGGGKSTKAAATKLSQPRVPWYANTFSSWTNSGGNGAAMRIQPHVWAATELSDPMAFLMDVVRNSACTHSHPAGMMGAVVHALALAHALERRQTPSPDDLLGSVDVVTSLPNILQHQRELDCVWRPALEREAGRQFKDLWRDVASECKHAIRATARAAKRPGARGYATIVNDLELREPARRGSGILTAVAALGLIWCEERPQQAMRIAANEAGTDTDTIATMAGAMLGATNDVEPPVDVLDSDLFASEAQRLARIASGDKVAGHRYPDLLLWIAPSSRADSLTCSEAGHLYVRGLGRAKAIEDPVQSPSGFSWQWIKLDLGQTLFIKRRQSLAAADEQLGPDAKALDIEAPAARSPVSQDAGRYGPERHQTSSGKPAQKPFDLHKALAYVREHHGDDREIGRAIRRVALKGNEGELAVFLANLVNLLKASGPIVTPSRD